MVFLARVTFPPLLLTQPAHVVHIAFTSVRDIVRMSDKGVTMNRTARLLAIVLATILVGGGIYIAYQNGFDAGAVSAVAAQEGDGATVVVDHGWRRGGYGFFPFGFLFPVLFLFLIFGAFRGRWGPPRWGYGPGGIGPEQMEQRLEEWHKKAHEQS